MAGSYKRGEQPGNYPYGVVGTGNICNVKKNENVCEKNMFTDILKTAPKYESYKQRAAVILKSDSFKSRGADRSGAFMYGHFKRCVI